MPGTFVLRAAALFSALSLIAALAACGSEEPPEDGEEPSGLDDSGIEAESTAGSGAGVRAVTFRLLPGTTFPNAELRITNLDDVAPVVSVTSDADGGARFSFEGSDGDEIRLQVVTETRRYQPVDYALGTRDGADSLARIRRPACLTLAPGLELAFETNLAQLSVYNQCEDALNLAEPRLRAGELGAAFELVTLMPVVIGGGVSAGIEFRLPQSASRPAEDVLLMDAEVGSEQLRYAIGLYAPR